MRRGDRLAAPWIAGAGLGLAALFAAGAADAYCRTASCMNGAPHTAAVCNPPQTDDCGTPIAWPKASPCVEYSVQENASEKVTFAQTQEVMQKAFATWLAAPCPGGGTPSILVSEGPAAVCAKHEYNQALGNANIILYHDDVWPYEGSDNTLALTTVTYNLDTGDIYDADMELNTADTNFTVSDTNVDFDLLSVVTHESGHFLGLAHSADSSATMFPVYNEHTTNLRNLSADDIAGICAIYPPGPAITNCDPTPRHGFSSLCAADQTPPSKSGCSASPAPERDGRAASAGVLAALGALALAMRARRRRLHAK